jgi:hypothetical protein
MRNPDAVQILDTDLRAIFAGRLRSLAVYGAGGSNDIPLNTLAVVETLTAADLRRCAERVPMWHGQGLATPLFLEAHEFSRSLDAFPFEFGAILADHVVVSGVNPFEGLAVDPADLRRACEVQARSHLLHLREGFLETRGRADLIATLVVRSAAPLAALLAHVSTLAQVSALPQAPDAAGVLARVVELAPAGTISSDEAQRLFPDYLDAVDRLVTDLDTWGAA